MKLTADARAYVNNCFGQRVHEITRDRERKLQDLQSLRRGGAQDGLKARAWIDSIEALANA